MFISENKISEFVRKYPKMDMNAVMVTLAMAC
jgi:hypothetical protein